MRATTCQEAAIDSRNIEIYLSGSTVRSSAYIGLAVILAVFMLTFAVAPKVRTQDSSDRFVGANDHSTWKQPGTDSVLRLVPPTIGT